MCVSVEVSAAEENVRLGMEEWKDGRVEEKR